MKTENIRNFMDRLTGELVPGNTISIYHKNKEIYRYSSGFSDVENGIKMTGDELLNIYSCSKLTTVIAALKLYEQGYFLLDDPIYEYIPEFKEMYIKLENGELKKCENPITIRNLFTMTAGFSYNLTTPSIEKVREKTNGAMPTVEVAKAIAKDALLYEPGTRWGYSLGHDVLAALVEVISQKRFSAYVKESIFDPIGIKDAYYHRTDAIRNKMASQYTFVSDDVETDIVKAQISSTGRNGSFKKEDKEVNHVLGSEYDSGGAGIVVAVPEYAKFASTLANGGIAPNGERIISKNTIELLKTNQLNDVQLKDFNWSQLTGYGYGLGVRTLIDKAKSGSLGPLGEFGWGGAAGSTILCDTENELAFFYAHHMLNPHEDYYQPRLRNVVYGAF